MAIAAGLYACGGGETTETESKPISNATTEESAPVKKRQPLLLQKRRSLLWQRKMARPSLKRLTAAHVTKTTLS